MKNLKIKMHTWTNVNLQMGGDFCLVSLQTISTIDIVYKVFI